MTRVAVLNPRRGNDERRMRTRERRGEEKERREKIRRRRLRAGRRRSVYHHSFHAVDEPPRAVIDERYEVDDNTSLVRSRVAFRGLLNSRRVLLLIGDKWVR